MGIKPLLSPALINWINLRNKKIIKSHSFKNSYWFHASSGEIEYCKSIIRLIKEKQPESQIVLTYSSPSAEKLFSNISDYVDQFIPLCWDQISDVNELFDYLQPKCLVFSKTDLWPELITQAHKRNIKLGVISFNPKLNLLNQFLLKSLLVKFSFISCIDEKNKPKLQSIAPHTEIRVDGDTRFDQVFHRLNQPSKINILTNSKVLVCGSTWPEDENVLLYILKQLIHHNFKIVIAPHEVDRGHVTRIAERLAQQNISFQLFSDQNISAPLNLNKEVLLIDKIGFLADCYRHADVAFIGGSYKEKVHSVMEALCCGVGVVVGPYYKNNPEAKKYISQYVLTSNNAEELLKGIQQQVSLNKTTIINEMKTHQFSSAKIVEILLPL